MKVRLHLPVENRYCTGLNLSEPWGINIALILGSLLESQQNVGAGSR